MEHNPCTDKLYMLVTTKTFAVLVNCMVIDLVIYVIGIIALDDFLLAIRSYLHRPVCKF